MSDIDNKARHKVFLSYGTPYRSEQEAFISAIEEYLRNRNCDTLTIGRKGFFVSRPVQFARDLIAECDGIIIIAFGRLRIVKGKDKPDSRNEKPVDDRLLPTVWNHIEAAMGYAHDIPILTLVEDGLHREGMLSDRFEWYAQEVKLIPSLLTTDQFQQLFNDWLRQIEKKKILRKVGTNTYKI